MSAHALRECRPTANLLSGRKSKQGLLVIDINSEQTKCSNTHAIKKVTSECKNKIMQHFYNGHRPCGSLLIQFGKLLFNFGQIY